MGCARALVFAALWLVGSLSVADAQPPGSPASRLSDADTASEFWDLAADLESGHRILARFSITNEGPGSRTAFALGHIVFPDGRVFRFTNGRRQGRWQLLEEGRHLDIGSSVLDLGGPARHFEVDKNKQGIKVYLDWKPTGEVMTWSAAPPGYAVDLVEAGAAVSGTIWLREAEMADPVAVRGSVSVTHTSIEESESRLVARRIDVHGTGASAGVYAIGVVTPDGGSHGWWVQRNADGSRRFFDGVVLEPEGAHDGSSRDYPVPERLGASSPGLTGEVEMGRVLESHDPLAVAPQPFRWFLSFRTKPRRIWLEARFRLRAPPDAAPPLEGAGLVSLFYLNPMR